jgi:hypothetical protein
MSSESTQGLGKDVGKEETSWEEGIGMRRRVLGHRALRARWPNEKQQDSGHSVAVNRCAVRDAVFVPLRGTGRLPEIACGEEVGDGQDVGIPRGLDRCPRLGRE